MSSEKESVKRTKYLKNKSELLDAVRDCMIFRLTDEESLRELQERGFDISERTLRRKKTLVDELDKKRTPKLASEEYALFAVKSINSLNKIEKKLWNIVNQSKNAWAAIGAIDKLIKIIEKKDELYNLSPVIAALLKKLKE